MSQSTNEKKMERPTTKKYYVSRCKDYGEITLDLEHILTSRAEDGSYEPKQGQVNFTVNVMRVIEDDGSYWPFDDLDSILYLGEANEDARPHNRDEIIALADTL